MHDYTNRPINTTQIPETYTYMVTQSVGKVALKSSGFGIVFTTNETCSNWMFIKN